METMKKLLVIVAAVVIMQVMHFGMPKQASALTIKKLCNGHPCGSTGTATNIGGDEWDEFIATLLLQANDQLLLEDLTSADLLLLSSPGSLPPGFFSVGPGASAESFRIEYIPSGSNAVPEPSTMVLLGGGLLLWAGIVIRRRMKAGSM